MRKNANQIPVSYYNLILPDQQFIHKIRIKKRSQKPISLNSNTIYQKKKSLSYLKLCITPSISFPASPVKPKAKNKLLLARNHNGSKSLLKTTNPSLSSQPRTIIVNSVLKDFPLKLINRPCSALIPKARKNKSLAVEKRVSKRMKSNESQKLFMDESIEVGCQSNL